MHYILLEIQASNDAASTIATAFDTLNEANSRYHTILAAAAVSSVPTHTAVLLSEDGKLLKSECYRHAE